MDSRATADRIRERIAAVVDEYPLSKWFFKNSDLPHQFNPGDYLDAWFIRWEEDILKSLPLLEGWGLHFSSYAFKAVREDMTLSLRGMEFEKGVTLEDIVLLVKMFQYRLVEGSSEMSEWCKRFEGRLRYYRASFLYSEFLEDLCCLLCMLPASEKAREYFINIRYHDNKDQITLSRTWEFLDKNQEECALDIRDEFMRRIFCYVEPLICESGLWRKIQPNSSLSTCDQERDLEILKNIGVREEVILIDDDYTSTLSILEEVVRNLGGRVKWIANKIRGERTI